MKQISLRKASLQDEKLVIGFDYRLNQVEHVEQKRAEKIAKAISNKECYIIQADKQAVGYALFDYRFFDQGWIELIVLDEAYRSQGIGAQAMNLICKESKTSKIFTSTNSSNLPMQKALKKINFSFAGKIDGLDEGDPELFYYKKL